MTRVYPTSIRLTSKTINASLGGLSKYYGAEQLKQYWASIGCIERLGLIYGLEREKLTLTEGKLPLLQPTVFPMTTQLRARSYLSLQLANSNDWFVSKLLPCVGLWQQSSSVLTTALRELCQRTHWELAMLAPEGKAEALTKKDNNWVKNWVKNLVKNWVKKEQRPRLKWKAGGSELISNTVETRELMFMRLGLALLAYKRKSAKHGKPVAPSIGKLQLQLNPWEQLVYKFPFLSLGVESVNLHEIDLLCPGIVKTTQDPWVLKCVPKDYIFIFCEKEKEKEPKGEKGISSIPVNFSAMHTGTLETVYSELEQEQKEKEHRAKNGIGTGTEEKQHMKPFEQNCLKDVSQAKQPAYCALKPVSTYLYRFNRPNELNLFINFLNPLPTGMEQTLFLADSKKTEHVQKPKCLLELEQGKDREISKSKSYIKPLYGRQCLQLLLLPFLPNGFPHMDCIGHQNVHRLQSVARFTLTLGASKAKEKVYFRQTLSIRL
jgi:hypothetical protein